MLAPIVLFVYNRPSHTQQTLEALAKNDLADESILYVFADGPKANASDDELDRIQQTKELVKSKKWCKDVILVERKYNEGLANSIIAGVTEVVNKYGKVIILEDDIVTSPYFLTYCNDGLNIYQDNQNVYSINAYQFPLNIDKVTTFLSPLATSTWGWATWADKWKIFSWDILQKDVIQNHPLLTNRFNLADYDFATMLNNNNSWGIRWYYSVFIRNGLGLFPSRSLVRNIGFDGSGMHCGDVSYLQEILCEKIQLQRLVNIDLEYYALSIEYFKMEKASVFFLKRLIMNFIS